MSSVNIVKYFEEREVAFAEKVKAACAEKVEQQAALNAILQELQTTEGKLSSKEAFKKQAVENGLDTTPVDNDIHRVRMEYETFVSQRDALRAAACHPVPQPPFDAAKVMRELKGLAQTGCTDAQVVPTLDDAARLIEVIPSGLTTNDDGVVVKAAIRFGNRTVAEVAVSTESPRFEKSFRPKPLSWLPRLANETAGRSHLSYDHGPIGAVVIAAAEQLMLPTGFTFDEEERHWNGSLRHQRQEVDARGLPYQHAGRLLAAAVESIGGALDVAGDYENVFVRAVKAQVLQNTSAESRWEMTREFPSSDKVLAMIKDDWSHVAAAPWSRDIVGVWAKLKYTIENGERPRFWCEKHKDHYAFRVRTRDHSWITGRVFIDRTQTPSAQDTPLARTEESTGHSEPETMRVGRMYLRVTEQRDERH
ncbi:MAG TPA: hypothetical protein PKE29_16595 [Phycisphaerales bacterium]|nr:hypothetical protein [Phycisphaerales bacterium]